VPHDAAGRGDASLHLTVEQFRAQLRLIAHEADLVSLPTLLAEHGRAGRRVAVTFDDAYTGCLRLGVPACHEAGVQPTVFVAPALLGRFAPWDVLAYRGAWNDKARSHFLEASQGMAAALAEPRCEGLPDDYRIGSLSALSATTKAYRVDIGNHTQHHVNLGAVGALDAEHEVTSANTFLTQQFPGYVRSYLAYPYGIASKQPVVGGAHQAVTHAFLVSGGWLGPEAQAAGPCIPRLNVPAGGSLARLRAQLRGWRVG
jgi:peptidoglycan/xylan/chitin deacetylase (PgdA/CDA1 family)